MMSCLSDLPTGALAQVSSFLASPSRALFAVALVSRDVERSSAIAGSEWDELYFGDIEKELAAKLSDDDISAVLLCIDAVNTLKKLRLTNCINITGAGLEPLRGSAIIEKIDLSLVGDHESPVLNPEPPISCTEVLPVLDSIVERGGESALKHLQFPKVWREERNAESDFHAFLRRYNEFLGNRDVSCSKCNCNLPGDNSNMICMNGLEHVNGTQNFTCCDCMKHYCYECEDDNGVDCLNNLCDKCERRYCLHCSREKDCTSCNDWFCADCIDFKECTRCHDDTCIECVSEMGGCCGCGLDNIWCRHCVDNHGALSCCEGCGVNYCNDCYDSNVYAPKLCVACQDSLCGQCRVNRCKEGMGCTGCYRFAFPALLENNKMQLQEVLNQNNELRKENNELKRKIEDLTG